MIVFESYLFIFDPRKGPLQYEAKFAEMLILGKKIAVENGGARKTKIRVAVHKNSDQNIPNNEEHHCDVGKVLFFNSYVFPQGENFI